MAGRDLTKVPLEEFERILHPDAEFDIAAIEVPDMETLRGREATLRGWAQWLEQWDDYRMVGSGMAEHGDHVVLDLHIDARGRGSGAPMSIDVTQVWSWREGKVTRIALFPSREAALEALEETPSRSAPGAAGAPRTPPAR